MRPKVINIGVISKEDYQKRTIAIAKGTYKPTTSEPKVWFESVKSMAQVLSSDNQKLLKLIVDHKPRSLAELERISHRKKSNLSRTLKTLARYGIVELPKEDGKLVPRVKATDFNVTFGLNYSQPIKEPIQDVADVSQQV
jgi:predicted transcriptional regulator